MKNTEVQQEETQQKETSQGEKFSYAYNAPTKKEKREIVSIRRQYQPQQQSNNKLERLRALDKRVKDNASVTALCFGIIGCLIFGGGMALMLEAENLLLGIPVSLVGMIPMVLAYPVYNAVLKKNKAKYGAEILKLSEELLGEEK